MSQAVVLIHGIGEQKPMSTLRSFVKAVLPPAENGREQYRSKPDRMSELFELRRLTSTGRSSTHFYEYYWAYHVEGTTWWHLFQWFTGLLFRRPSDVPSGLKTIWGFTWMALIGIVISIPLGYMAAIYTAVTTLPHFSFVWIVGMILLLTLQGFILYWVGDAARYLSPSPENIALRQKVRSEGVRLLRRLHRSHEYERIIVVGHSLGSVIGYDIITRLWLDYHQSSSFKSRLTSISELLDAHQHPQPIIGHELPRKGKALVSDENGNALGDFRIAQLDGWKEQRYYRNPWRISDFVTIGSPLVHAMLLLASSSKDFNDRKQQRELLTCPPVSDNKGYGYTDAPIALPHSDKKYSPHMLHHAAVFGVTRWSNLYFPAFGGLFGDFIGGPLRPVLGPGIRDIPVRSNSWRRFTPLTHTDYWETNRLSGQAASVPGCRDALEALKDALGLDRLYEYRVNE
ncbi:MAG: hypothetical protein KF722_02390 [Nitrospira sp.]|nr:hypothetical protein [Nitrospira sp.]